MTSIDKIFQICLYAMILPIMLSSGSKLKSKRIIGLLSMIIYIPITIIAALPCSLIAVSCISIELIKDYINQ